MNGQPVTSTTGITATDFVVVTNPTLNEGTQSTSGIDLAAAYSERAGPGKLALQLTGNYLLSVHDASSGCPGGTEHLVGAIGNACGDYPRITGRVAANYNVGRFGLYVQERYIHKGKINPNFESGVDITFNEVPAIWYTDLNFNCDLGSWSGGTGSVFVNVTNLFNRDPPVTTSSSRSWIVPTEFGLYDVLGRRYTLGVRFKM